MDKQKLIKYINERIKFITNLMNDEEEGNLKSYLFGKISGLKEIKRNIHKTERNKE